MIRIKRGVPDLVVTDMLMPVMDGGALIQHLRSDPQTAEVPIVAVTGSSDAKAHAVDADVVMSKPFHQSALLEIVQSLLGAPKLSYG